MDSLIDIKTYNLLTLLIEKFYHEIRQKKGLNHLKIDEENNSDKREKLLDLLTDAFEKNINGR